MQMHEKLGKYTEQSQRNKLGKLARIAACTGQPAAEGNDCKLNLPWNKTLHLLIYHTMLYIWIPSTLKEWY